MEKLIIGKVINTRGLKGEMKIENRSSFIKERYKAGNIIYLSLDEKNFIEKKISRVSFSKGFIYLILEGINSLDDANKYREYYLYCDSSDLKEKKDIYHFLTLKDMRVIFNGNEIGKIIDIENNTKHDLIRIDTGVKTFLIPFIKDFIVNIDKENKVMEVTNIEVFYED